MTRYAIKDLSLTDPAQGHVAIAVVECTTWFGLRRRTRHLACVRATAIMGGSWVDQETMEPLQPDDALTGRLNDAAQALVHRGRTAMAGNFPTHQPEKTAR